MSAAADQKKEGAEAGQNAPGAADCEIAHKQANADDAKVTVDQINDAIRLAITIRGADVSTCIYAPLGEIIDLLAKLRIEKQKDTFADVTNLRSDSECAMQLKIHIGTGITDPRIRRGYMLDICDEVIKGASAHAMGPAGGRPIGLKIAFGE